MESNPQEQSVGVPSPDGRAPASDRPGRARRPMKADRAKQTGRVDRSPCAARMTGESGAALPPVPPGDEPDSARNDTGVPATRRKDPTREKRVCVLSMDGRILASCRPARARQLMKAGKARPARRVPGSLFTIRMTVETGEDLPPMQAGDEPDFVRNDIGVLAENGTDPTREKTVCVLGTDGRVLAPCSPKRAQHLLQVGRAKPVRRIAGSVLAIQLIERPRARAGTGEGGNRQATAHNAPCTGTDQEKADAAGGCPQSDGHRKQARRDRTPASNRSKKPGTAGSTGRNS